MKDKFETLFKPEIQRELLLRASIGCATKEGLRFFEIHCNPNARDKLPKGFADSYIFVTTDDQKAALAAKEFNHFLETKAKEIGHTEFPGLEYLYEIKGRNLKALSPSANSALDEVLEKFIKATEGLEQKAREELTPKNKKLLDVLTENITKKVKSPKIKKNVQRILLRKFYRAQKAGFQLSAQVFDKEAPSHRQVKLSPNKDNKERER